MATVSKTAINVAVCCDAAKILSLMPKDMKQVKVGTLYGQAVDFIQRADAAGGPPALGFGGSFEIVPSITKVEEGGVADTFASGNLFLQAQFREHIKKPLNAVLYPDPKKPDKKARGAVEFAAEIFVTRANNDDGFSWGLDFLIEPAVVDALAAIKTRIKPAAKK